MSARLLAALLIGASPALAQGQVDPAIHKLCTEAKDYVGCVRAMKGETNTTLRTIQSEGSNIAEGNACPASYAYRGGGMCQEVKCTYEDGNDPLLGGKNHKCGNASFWSGYIGRMTLRWGSATTRSHNDANCPPGEPGIGWTSTCNTAPEDWESPAVRAAREAKDGPKCDFKLKAYNCSYTAYLEANPGIKKWAELNPELAEKEKGKLQATD